MPSVSTYIREAIEELHQVRWPTRHQAVRFSAIVIGFTAASAVVFGVVDYLLSLGLTQALSIV